MAAARTPTLALLCVLSLGSTSALTQPAHPGEHALALSPGLLELLRAEMRELLDGVRALPAGIATADWQAVKSTSARIRASYILAQRLTPEQKAELAHALPDHFKRLDAQFHAEAGKLEAAAANHDAQLAAFHYYRLLDTCSTCHAAYAPARFPGFVAQPDGGHGH